ncbi:2'-5' RNA ligase family protein [Nocardia goodfellowii]
MTATSRRPFPLVGPGSTSDAGVIRENDWSAFEELSTVHDHWSLEQWESGQASYYWYLTFSEPGLVDLVAQCQARLAEEGFDPVPLDGLHMTLLNIGRVGEVSERELGGIADAGRRAAAAVQPFRLRVGPLTGSQSALRFSVTPWDQLLDLHRRLRSGTAEHRPSSGLAETSDFRPHLGIGYLNRDQGAGQLISDVGALRSLPAATVRVRELHLVELRRVDRAYRWSDCAVIPLG